MKPGFGRTPRVSGSLIVLSGLDGSGKSTQAALLAERLRGEGVRARAIWNRWNPFISAPFIRIARRHLRVTEGVGNDDYRSFTEAKRKKMRSAWKRNVWQLMVWSEYSLQVHGRLFRHRIAGTKVICDRYVYDTLIDIAINFSVGANDIRELMSHPLLSLFPKPALVIFIDIDPEVGAARKSDGTPPTYLADRRAYYAALSHMLSAPLIDGGASVTSVSDTIWELTKDWRSHLKAASAQQTGQGSGA
jgi:thymidylate kinase